MAHQSDLIAEDIEAYLKAHEQKSLLRFITCGSVDDGKSSLIGRLLYESQMLFEDQLAALESDSKKVGTRGEELDYALLLDGLAAEREQGITIDVAYRYFSTDRRKFIVADTPGHEQYTRNMVTGASTADLAIILIDARKGMLTQTRRHSTLVSLIGIRHVVLAVNKMDLVDYSEARFKEIEQEYRKFAAQLGIQNIIAIPLSAVKGDNVIMPMGNTSWYTGPSLMPYLETVELDSTAAQNGPFRLPVQWVNRPNLDFRGFTGTIVSGDIRPGERITVMPSGKTSTVSRIVSYSGDLSRAVAEQAVTLTLADEIDISRGDLICREGAPSQVGSKFKATLVWMDDEAMAVDRSYFMKIGARTVAIQIRALDFRLDIDAQQEVAATTLALNGIGQVEIEADRPIPFDPYDQNRDTGGFILINRITNSTIAAGMLRSAMDSSTTTSHSHSVHESWNLDDVVSKLRSLRDEWRALQQRDRDTGGREFPSLEVLKQVVKGLTAALFPMRLGPANLRKESEDVFVRDTLAQALSQLKDQILLELNGRARQIDPQSEKAAQERADAIVADFAEKLPEVRRLLDLDVEAAYRGDPAASSVDEILLCYPGVAAIMHYRLAHALSLAGLPLIARIIAEIAHSETGVDIHPAAKIGESFFIDHGTGVVIGGTATIGRNVRIYQAVTLGAKRLTAQDGGLIDRSQPRHPQVEDDVIIYAGATILGYVTIGKGSTIGGNVWLTHSVPANSQITQAQSQAAPC